MLLRAAEATAFGPVRRGVAYDGSDGVGGLNLGDTTRKSFALFLLAGVELSELGLKTFELEDWSR